MSDLSPAAKEMVLHWGEMGSLWGLSRTAAQVYALLYLSQDPLSADEIAEQLQCARSNISNAVKQLRQWGVLKTAGALGERREYYTVLDDVWETFRKIVAERKRREIDPTAEMLKTCLEEQKAYPDDGYAQERMASMLSFFEMANRCYDQIDILPVDKLIKLAERVQAGWKKS